MGYHYIYRCFNCREEFSPARIEEHGHYLCPLCGKAEKKLPLEGVLQIAYDYPALRRELRRERFLRLPAGQMWHYPQLWPLQQHSAAGEMELKDVSGGQLEKLALPANLLARRMVDNTRILILDDTRNPTFSYKDRASILVALKALQLGLGEIAVASTGNAASSLAGICARLSMKANIWVPEAIPQAKLLQMQAYGAQVHLVRGDYDTAFDLCLELSRRMGWYNRNTAYNPLTIEGKKSAAYDIFITAAGNMPDSIFVPTGDGVILAGLFKGLWELRELGWLEKIPRLIAVQSSRSDALVRYWSAGRFVYRESETIADSIGTGAPRNLYLAVHNLRESDGLAISLPDEDILAAQKMAAREMGLLLEPAAAASLAGYLKLRKEGAVSGQERALLLCTGNGLKDVQSLRRWIKPLNALSPQQWRETFCKSEARRAEKTNC